MLYLGPIGMDCVNGMDESFQDSSWIQDLEADFP